MWESFARWNPDEVRMGNTLNETTDTHTHKAEAEGVVTLLKREGLGGEGQIYPIETGVREITQA